MLRAVYLYSLHPKCPKNIASIDYDVIAREKYRVFFFMFYPIQFDLTLLF